LESLDIVEVRACIFFATLGHFLKPPGARRNFGGLRRFLEISDFAKIAYIYLILLKIGCVLGTSQIYLAFLAFSRRGRFENFFGFWPFSKREYNMFIIKGLDVFLDLG